VIIVRRNWLWGFSAHIEKATNMQAEVMAIHPGLKATWLNNIRQVIVESDSVWALRLVSQAIASSHHPLGSIVNIY